MGNTEPQPDTFCHQAEPHVEVLRHQPSHKIIELQSVLPSECSGIEVKHSNRQRDLIRQMMGTDTESHIQTLDRTQESCRGAGGEGGGIRSLRTGDRGGCDPPNQWVLITKLRCSLIV